MEDTTKSTRSVLGVTGSRHGMSKMQRRCFAAFLDGMEPLEFHHGDCNGADETAHEIFEEYAARVVAAGGERPIIFIHPPTNCRYRADCYERHHQTTSCDMVEFRAADYMARNQAIVNKCDTLVAFPDADEADAPRSGTWATVRRARKKGLAIVIFYSDGRVGN